VDGLREAESVVFHGEAARNVSRLDRFETVLSTVNLVWLRVARKSCRGTVQIVRAGARSFPVIDEKGGVGHRMSPPSPSSKLAPTPGVKPRRTVRDEIVSKCVGRLHTPTHLRARGLRSARRVVCSRIPPTVRVGEPWISFLRLARAEGER
jgi:hypothetical protein